MNEAGVPCGPIYNLEQTFADVQVQHLGMAKPIRHPTLGDIAVVNQPFKLSAVPDDRAFAPTPDTGAQTESILAEIGYDAKAVAGLRQRGVI
jgi:formyl-CoA transferase